MTSEASQLQLAFVRILKEHTVLLDKSQQLCPKKEKSEAIRSLIISEYTAMTGVQITEEQIRKRLNNCKTDVKKKADLNKTGNKPIKLKEWEVIFLELLNPDENPSISCIPGGLSVGADNPIRMQTEKEADIPIATEEIEELPRDSPVTKRRKLKFNETEETKNLSNGELQRLVLLEQLKLIRMQQEEIKKRMEYNNEERNSYPTYNSTTTIESELTFLNL